MKLCVFVAFLFTVVSVSARLGETESELTARFGPGQLRSAHNILAQGKFIPIGERLHYREGDWRITVDLIGGRCQRITYKKPGDWTEEQLQTVLSANNQGATWQETTKSLTAKLRRTWARSDSGSAEWTRSTGVTLTARAYEIAKEQAEERARIDAGRKPKI